MTNTRRGGTAAFRGCLVRSNIMVLVLASFLIGMAVGALLIYMYFSARLQQAKQRFADELHVLVEREERATQASRRTAA
jgi:hypothetical protein